MDDKSDVSDRRDLMRKTAHGLLIFSTLLAVFLTYTNRVDDLDLWWHLRSGQVIFETHKIPQKDYLSYTTDIPESISQIGINEVAPNELPSEENNRYWSAFLKSSWLSQLVFYVVYLIGKFKGIGILKSAIFVLTYLVLYITMLRRKSDPLSSFIILCLVVFIGKDFDYTRPQIFSFLLFTCTLYTLYDFRKGGKSIYFLPLLILFWANLHGGFILGELVVFAFTLAELLKYLLNNRFGMLKISCLQKGQLRRLFTFSLISGSASLLNPNGFKTLSIFFLPWLLKHSIFASIEEYQRPMFYEYHAFWLMLALEIISILVLIKKKKLDLTELFLFFILALPSLMSIRYIIFFALGTGVFLAYSVSYVSLCLKEQRVLKEFTHKVNFSRINLRTTLSLLLAVVFLIFSIKATASRQVFRFDMGEKRYPSGAVAFIHENKIPKNIFNLYNWGGFLTWHLYPEYRVFIYGLGLNETAFFHYNQIIKAERGKNPSVTLWKKLLNAYNINSILINSVSSTGNIIPLVDNLYQDKDWELVYADGKSMIFLRATPENHNLIRQYRKSKEEIANEIVSECEHGIKDFPATWGYYETLGFIYMKENRLKEALNMFQKYLSMNPNNKTVRYYHDLVKQYVETYSTNP